MRRFHFLPGLFLAAFLLAGGTRPVAAQHMQLWNSEADQNGCVWSYGIMDSVAAADGRWCFRGVPDRWHRPAINLGCQPTWRADISHLDVLRFKARTDLPGATFKVRITGWPWTSREISVDPYVEGGVVDTTWRVVTLPLDSLRTTEYSLNTVEFIAFGLAEPLTAHHVFIEDVWALDLGALQVEGVQALTNAVLRLEISGRPDTAVVKNPLNYRISSSTDPRFLDGVHPRAVGYRSAVVDLASGAIPTVEHDIFLVLPDSLGTGHSYQVTVLSLPDPAGNDLPQAWSSPVPDPLEGVNGSVKCNQVGYLPESPKYGYLGNYLGDAGAMPLSPTQFRIRRVEDGVEVFSGTPQFRGDDLVLSGEVVWDCDFSAFTQDGHFFLEVPQVGRSHPFTIGDSVYEELARTTGRALYFQRCGTSLDLAHTEGPWTHGLCHAQDGVVHACHMDSPLHQDEVVGSTLPATCGWHDAGDYGKYVPTAAVALQTLFTLWELAPERFADGAWNIPESGNGIPDLLDECKWEVEWLRGMQAPDGGVFLKLTTTDWADDMPELDTDTRWLSPKTTHSTGQFAAVMAAAGRVYRPWLPDFADSCLAQARRAWAFLESHPECEPAAGFVNPEGIGGGAYTDPLGDADERAWASAELYKSTGEPAFHDAFSFWWPQHAVDWGWNDFQHSQIKASWAYATTGYPLRADWVEAITAEMREDLEQKLVPRTWENAYRNANRTDVIEWIAWGTFAHSSVYSLDFIKAIERLGDEAWRDEMLVNLDSQLGANPLGITFITGVGERSPLDPLHHPSLADGVMEPVPGIPVFGPVAHMPMSNAYYAQAQAPENLYPKGEYEDDPYPILRRYFDIAELVMMSEFTITDMAVCAAVYGYLGGRRWQGRAAAFDVDQRVGVAPMRVSFHNQSLAVDVPEGDWWWDFGDGSFSTEREPVHTYAAGTWSPVLVARGDGAQPDTLTRLDLVRVLPLHPAVDLTWTPSGMELCWEGLPSGAWAEIRRSAGAQGPFVVVGESVESCWVDASAPVEGAFYQVVAKLP